MRLSAGQKLICIMFGCAMLSVMAFVVIQVRSAGEEKLTPKHIALMEEKLGQLGDPDGNVMKLREMGVTDPKIFPADEVMIPDRSTILGIEVDGKYRAYLFN